MKTKLAHRLCATVLAAVGTSGPTAAQTAQPFEGLAHPPMQAYRNPNGSIARLHNSIVTAYWSGYAVTASAPYTSPPRCSAQPRARRARCKPGSSA